MFDVIGKRNWFFLFSALIVVPGFIFILLTPLTNGKEGLQFSVDYTGGTVFEFQMKDPNVTVDQVKAVVVKQGLPDAEVSEDSAHYFTVRTKETNLVPLPTPSPTPQPTPVPSASPSGSASASPSASASGSPSASPSGSGSTSPSPSSSASASTSPSASPSASATASPSTSPSPSPSPTPQANSIGQDGKACGLSLPTTGKLADVVAGIKSQIGPIACTRQTTTVGAIVSSDLINQAIILILVGSAGILLWIALRFHSFKFGATALAALVHDVIVVVGIFAILGTFFGVQIDSLFVTAMLTVIGFSVHDTIVVYDRIRENKARHAGEPFDRIVNHSILQTFGRSINTSLTVVITLTALLLFGGSAIHYFVLALLIGIISGTYSSIFNASPLLVVWQLWDDRRREAKLAAQRSTRPRRAGA